LALHCLSRRDNLAPVTAAESHPDRRYCLIQIAARYQGKLRVALPNYSADSVCGHDRVHRHRLLLLDQHRGALRNSCIAAPTIESF
jgi:hypothetical protein